ncbi:tyrosine-type recombinase/integrase [Lysinibacillus sphaericus]|uniref:tyrosine-type recombinase/integrase n=1 Tax=Lysinibacillus sphaericus TaxID=1421 RepID=UPI003F7A6C77
MEYRSQTIVDYELNGFRGKSENTKKTYVKELELFEIWLGDKGSTLDDFTFVELQQYMNFHKKLDAKAATINKKLNSIRHFCNYAGVIQKCDGINVMKPESNLPAPKSLTRNERNAMLREASKRGNRDYAIVCFMLYTGVRVDECVNAEIRHLFDIGDKKGFIRIVGKGNKERVIPLNSDVRLALKLYLHERDIDIYDEKSLELHSYEPLFISTHRKKVSVRRIQQIVRETGNTSPHALRHTFATILLREKKTDQVTVAQLLGHANLNVLQRYTQATLEERLIIVEDMGD